MTFNDISALLGTKTEIVTADLSAQPESDASVLESLYFCDIEDYLSPISTNESNGYGNGTSYGISSGNGNIPAGDLAKSLDYLSSAESTETENADAVSSITDAIDGSGNYDLTETAVIEFSADTLKHSAVSYTLDVSPGDSITLGTLIGSFTDASSDGSVFNILSPFKSGVVRTDASDGGFGRLFKTICSRHIIIDHAIRGSSFGECGNNSFSDVSVLESDFDDFSKKISEATDAVNILCDDFPYCLYPVMLLYGRKGFYGDASVKNGELYNYKPRYCDTSYESLINEKENIDSSFLRAMKCSEKDYSSSWDDFLRSGITSKELETMGKEIETERNSYCAEMESLISDSTLNISNSFDPMDENMDIFRCRVASTFTVTNPETLKDFRLVPTAGDAFSVFYENLITLAGDASLSDIRKEYIEKLEYLLKERQKWEKKYLDVSAVEDSSLDVSLRSMTAWSLLSSDVSVLEGIYSDIKSVAADFPDVSSFMEETFSGSGSRCTAAWPKASEISVQGKTYRLYTFGSEAFLNNSQSKTETDTSVYVTAADISAGNEKRQELLDPCTSITPDASTATSSIKEEPTPLSLAYWKKYCTIATAVTSGYLATGLVIHGHPIKFPCLYIPLKVINIAKTGFISVCGCSIRGIWIDPFMLFLNLSADNSSVMTTLLGGLDSIKNTYDGKFSILNSAISSLCSSELEKVKASSTDLLKENRRYEAEEKELAGLNVNSKEDIEDSIFREMYGERRITDAERITDSSEVLQMPGYTVNADASALSDSFLENITLDASLDMTVSNEVKGLKSKLQ